MKKLCFGCMRQKSQSPVCEHCGYDETRDNMHHQLPVGTMLENQYLVGRVLGQGGFGITYIGWDQNLAVPVAIKEYFPTGVVHRHVSWGKDVLCTNGQTPEQFARHRERFLKEARTLAKLADIPEIVQIRSFFSANETAYIVMEYVQGTTLKEHLRQLGRPMTEKEALSIMEPVLRALQKVHEHGLIHRDISPDNIMLTVNGGIKLIDFGAVRYVDSSGATRSTEAVLKPGFAPLEQYNSRGNMGSWTDVYALSACFHYLLTGRRPAEAMDRWEQGQILPILRENPGLSSQLVKTLEQGMMLRPTERIQTVREMYQMLYSGRKTDRLPSEQTIKPEKKRTASSSGKRNGGWIPAAALLAVFLAAGSWLMTRDTTQETMSLPTAPMILPQETLEQAEPQDPAVQMQYEQACAYEEAGQMGKAAIAFAKLGDFRDSRQRSQGLWDRIAERKTMDCGVWRSFAVRNDGTLIMTEGNDDSLDAASQWQDLVAISSGWGNLVGLRKDGTVMAVGNNDHGQNDVSGWTDIVQISACMSHTVGLRADGTVVAVGNDEQGQCQVSHWEDVVYVTTVYLHMEDVFRGQTVGLRADGTVLVAGENEGNWCEEVSRWEDIVAVESGGLHIVGLKSDGTVVSATSERRIWSLYDSRSHVEDWTDIRSLSADRRYTLGLRADGTVVGVGNNDLYRNLEVSDWRNIASIHSGDAYTVGIRTDGTAVSAGQDQHGRPDVSGWTDLVAVDVGNSHILGLRSDGTVVAAGWGEYGQCQVSGWSDVRVPRQQSWQDVFGIQ